MRKLGCILILTSLVLACTSELNDKKINTPMGVARLWLENYYYHNDYELAKSYSTTETAAMIDTIKMMIFPDQQSQDKIKFEVKNIQCKQVQGEPEAECTCKYLEDGQPFTELLHLVQIDDQWLVDAQMGSDDDLLLDDDIEKMTKDFEQTLDQLLEQ